MKSNSTMDVATGGGGDSLQALTNVEYTYTRTET